MKIAHIINPVKVNQTSDLFIAQPITFETMQKAKIFAQTFNIEVELMYTCYTEDVEVAPTNFHAAGLLQRSILDYGTFEKQKKLPLIKDILDRLYTETDAEYLIYTNVDIAVMPHFYVEIKQIIEKGYDAFVINRRTISNHYTSIKEIPQMYSDMGSKHPGYDCFVFRRDIYTNYQLGTTCIGANWIGRVLIVNLIANAAKFKVFEDAHLTFHIGDDRNWKQSKFSGYDLSNETNLIELFKNPRVIKHNHELIEKIKKFHIKEESKQVVDVSSFDPNNIFYEIFHNQSKPINDCPVFIVGFPRSGTTFLLNKLVSQENVYSLPETHFFDIITAKNTLQSESTVKKVLSRIERWLPLSEEAKDFIFYLYRAKKLEDHLAFKIIIADYLRQQTTDIESIRNAIWIEKTPDHSLHMKRIKQLYPKAKFIYILRHPLPTFNSWRRVASGWGATWKPIEEYCKMWDTRIVTSQAFKSTHPNDLIYVKLENLRKNLLFELNKLCLYANIKFNAKVLDDINTEKSKILALDSEPWKKEALKKDIKKNDDTSNTDLTFFEQFRVLLYLQKLLLQFDYDMDIQTLAENTEHIYDINELSKTIQYFHKNHKHLPLANTNKAVNIQPLLEALHILTSQSTISVPLKKFRAYKKMIAIYHTIRKA